MQKSVGTKETATMLEGMRGNQVLTPRLMGTVCMRKHIQLGNTGSTGEPLDGRHVAILNSLTILQVSYRSLFRPVRRPAFLCVPVRNCSVCKQRMQSIDHHKVSQCSCRDTAY